MFRNVGYLRQGQTRDYDYTLILPEPLASWDVWDYWERERTTSIARVMEGRPGWLVDVGVETGWLSVAHAHTVGAARMCLVEGSAEAWPLARTVWHANVAAAPGMTVHGLAGPDPSGSVQVTVGGWPDAATAPVVDKPSYEYLHGTHTAGVFRVDELDLDLVGGVTVDVEGAELEVIAGTVGVLERDRPTVWISVHPDLMARDYGTSPDALFALLHAHGYDRGRLLATDHEQHWRFEPR